MKTSFVRNQCKAEDEKPRPKKTPQKSLNYNHQEAVLLIALERAKHQRKETTVNTINSKDYAIISRFMCSRSIDEDLDFSIREKKRKSSSFRECVSRNFTSDAEFTEFIQNNTKICQRVRAELHCFPSTYRTDIYLSKADGEDDLRAMILEAFQSDPWNFVEHIGIEIDTYNYEEHQEMISYHSYLSNREQLDADQNP